MKTAAFTLFFFNITFNHLDMSTKLTLKPGNETIENAKL